MEIIKSDNFLKMAQEKKERDIFHDAFIKMKVGEGALVEKKEVARLIQKARYYKMKIATRKQTCGKILIVVLDRKD